MNSRKYPRTMKEAFGPYTSDDLLPFDGEPPLQLSDLIIVAFFVGVVIAVLFGWLG